MSLKLARPLVCAKSFTWNETVWNPSMIQTALWLDANDASTINATSGAVNQWSDKSGNARHATASTTARPTYSATSFNAKPGLTFNGTSNILRADQTASIATGNDVPFSVFYVANIQASNQTKTSMGFGRALTSNDLHNFSFDGSNFYQSFRRDTALAINSIAGTSSAASANNIFSDVFTGTSATKYLNGNLYASGTLNVGTLILDQFGIGGLPVFNAVLEYISMTCSEILIIANAASQSTQQRIEGYLAHKWGLTASLPAGHPYKTAGPTP